MRRYRADPETSIEKAKQWAKNNRERLNARIKEWRAGNKAQAARDGLRRGGKDRTPENLAYVELILGDPCSYCGELKKPTIDHITPIVLGGDNNFTNLTPACQSCNSSKNDDTLIGFMVRRSPYRYAGFRA